MSRYDDAFVYIRNIFGYGTTVLFRCFAMRITEDVFEQWKCGEGFVTRAATTTQKLERVTHADARSHGFVFTACWLVNNITPFIAKVEPPEPEFQAVVRFIANILIMQTLREELKWVMVASRCDSWINSNDALEMDYRRFGDTRCFSMWEIMRSTFYRIAFNTDVWRYCTVLCMITEQRYDKS